MSLDYNIGKMSDINGLHNTKVGIDKKPFPDGSDEDKAGDWEWQKTQCMIFRSMSVGMNRITEENVDEFYVRMMMVTQMHGKPLVEWDEAKGKHVDRDVTYAEVRRRIGLTTNASTLTKAQFRKRFVDHFEMEATRERNRQAKKIDENMPSLASPGTGSMRVE